MKRKRLFSKARRPRLFSLPRLDAIAVVSRILSGWLKEVSDADKTCRVWSGCYGSD